MYTRSVKEAIHITLHPNNINKDSEIEIPEALDAHDQKTLRTWEPYDSGLLWEQLNNIEDQNAPITAVEYQPITAKNPAF